MLFNFVPMEWRFIIFVRSDTKRSNVPVTLKTNLFLQTTLGLRTPPLPIGRSGGSRWSVTESILFFFNCYQGCVFVVVVLFYFWLCWSLLSSSFLHGLSLVTVNRGYSLVVGRGLLTAVSSFVAEHGLSCLMKCSILVLRPGIELTSPAIGRWLLNCLAYQGSSFRSDF